MNAAHLAAFRDRAQRELQNLFPANITIDGQAYDVASGGLKRERDLISGGWLNKYQVVFFLSLAALTVVGKPVPKPRALVTINTLAGAAPQVATVAIETALLDATGTIVVLSCHSPEE